MNKPLQQKTCQCCLKRKPLETASFEGDSTSPDGYADICKSCISESLTDLMRDKAVETAAIADDAIRGRLNAEIAASSGVSHDGDYVPHIAGMFEAVMRQFGGVNGFAASLVSNYTCCAPGSPTRAKIAADILKLGTAVTAEGRSKSIDQMSDEELRLADERIQRKLAIAHSKPATRKEVIYAEQDAPRNAEAEVLPAGARTAGDGTDRGGSGPEGTGSAEALRAAGLAEAFPRVHGP